MALLDSESTTGAVRMTFRPGDMTIVDVETTLFPRVNLEHVGLGGIGLDLSSSARTTAADVDDIRPAVYESSGLQMLNGKGEWLWRPLHNPETLQISAFVDSSPRASACCSASATYEAFQDDDQRFERRPSLWIEPLGDWGQGSVQLLEIPTRRRDQRQHPRLLAAEGADGGGFRGRLRLSAVLVLDAARAAAARDRQRATRSGRGSGGRRRRFVVDFTGDMLGDDARRRTSSRSLTVGPGTFQNLKTLALSGAKDGPRRVRA